MDVSGQLRVKFKYISTCLFISLLSMGVFSSFADSVTDSTDTPWMVGISLGTSKPSLQNNNTTVSNGSEQPAPYGVDVYTGSKPASQENLSVLLGYQWFRNNSFLPQYSLSLRYQHLGSFGINGDVTEYSTYTNYSYHLSADSNNVMLLTKLDLYRFYSFFPYISVGLGEASNKMSDYSEQPFSGIIPRLSPGYTGTKHGFAYSLGVGIDYQVTARLSTSFGYEYANLGKLQGVGAAGSGWEGQTLSFGTLKSNTFLLSAAYQLPF